jgi:hypothetical protein
MAALRSVAILVRPENTKKSGERDSNHLRLKL